MSFSLPLKPLESSYPLWIIFLPFPLFILSWYRSWATKTQKTTLRSPPLVRFNERQLFENPRRSYEAALAEHGSVIAVPRKGFLEYVVDDKHTVHVLTGESKFSFEKGVARILNIDFMLWFHKGSVIRDMDALMREGMNPRLDNIVSHLWPVFERHAKELTATEKGGEISIDMFDYAHTVVAEAMILLILGKNYLDPRNQSLIIEMAAGLAELTGMYQNRSYFARTYPALWRMKTWLKFMFYTMGVRLIPNLGYTLWRDISTRVRAEAQGEKQDESEMINLISVLIKQHANPEGKITAGSKVWIIALLLCFIFASVHQTATAITWVVFELATRPDILKMLREELFIVSKEDAKTGDLNLNLESLTNAVYTDSFIREAMRTKGDILSTVRMTTQDVELDGMTIPKGFNVLPMTTLSHHSKVFNGEKASEFDAFRWVEEKKLAVTPGSGYLSFGIGRWACPGRLLAVNEIKMIIFSLISITTPRIRGGAYTVVDKLNRTSVPPEAELILEPYSGPF